MGAEEPVGAARSLALQMWILQSSEECRDYVRGADPARDPLETKDTYIHRLDGIMSHSAAPIHIPGAMYILPSHVPNQSAHESTEPSALRAEKRTRNRDKKGDEHAGDKAELFVVSQRNMKVQNESKRTDTKHVGTASDRSGLLATLG